MSRRLVHATIISAGEAPAICAFVVPCADHVESVNLLGFYLFAHESDFADATRIDSRPIEDGAEVVGAIDIATWIDGVTSRSIA